MAKYNQNFALPLANFKNRQLQQQVGHHFLNISLR